MIIVYPYSGADGNNDEGFEYHFIDCVIKGYSGQDNVHVAAIIKSIIKIIQRKFIDVASIVFQIDNASCLSFKQPWLINVRLYFIYPAWGFVKMCSCCSFIIYLKLQSFFLLTNC